jgi:hypothetical protein
MWDFNLILKVYNRHMAIAYNLFYSTDTGRVLENPEGF